MVNDTEWTFHAHNGRWIQTILKMEWKKFTSVLDPWNKILQLKTVGMNIERIIQSCLLELVTIRNVSEDILYYIT